MNPVPPEITVFCPPFTSTCELREGLAFRSRKEWCEYLELYMKKNECVFTIKRSNVLSAQRKRGLTEHEIKMHWSDVYYHCKHSPPQNPSVTKGLRAKRYVSIISK